MTNRVCTIAALFGILSVAHTTGPTALSRSETAAGWRSLFDGKSLRGWLAPAKNWDARNGAIVRTGSGGELMYVMYRLPADYELRFHWKKDAGGEWNTERIVCRGKVVEHSLNDAPLAESDKRRVDVGGCGEFLRFPDQGDAISYSAIYLRQLQPPASPPVFEEDLLSSSPLRIKLWKQMEAYA